MDNRTLLKEKRDVILAAARRHGVRNIRIFGSVARGEDDSESDIDLEPGRSILDHASLLIELQQLLGRKVDVVSERGIKNRIRERVLREAIPL
jgi:predicted nucleotidyltransferase